MKTVFTTLALGVPLSLALVACGGDSYEISDQQLQGQVGGAEWSFVSGDTDSFLSDEDAFFAKLYASAEEACGFGAPSGNRVILSVPTSPGDYELSLSRSMTFVVEESDGPLNLVATEGRLVVDEVTPTTVTGGIYARFDGGNEIDGNFSLTICTE